MNDQSVDELLDRWEELREQGRDVSLDELCGGDPQMRTRLESCIRALESVSWMDDSQQSLPVEHAVGRGPSGTDLPSTSLTPSAFADTVCQAGLLTDQELQQFQNRLTPKETEDESARSLARRIVTDGGLTTYQAAVLLEARDDPLLIDRYVILDTLGSGGMGVVFKALHKSMDRIVALKLLPPHAVDSPEKVERFQRETRAAAKLSHPHIVTVFDAAESNGAHFLAMEYISGPDLSTVVQQHGALPIAQAVRFIRDAALGLQHAHEQGIIHRDIKPGNLLLAADSTVKVADLGLALIETKKVTDLTEQHLTKGGVVLGTIAYLSPEQALESRLTDARSDIYSLGATLFCLLTGRPPYQESTPMKTLVAHREQPIPSLHTACEEVPEELDVICRRMLAKRPEDRFATMGEVVQAFEELNLFDEDPPAGIELNDGLDRDTTPIGSINEPTRPSVQNHSDSDSAPSGAGRRALWGVVIGSALILLGVIIVITTREGKTIQVEVPDGATVQLKPNGEPDSIKPAKLPISSETGRLALKSITRQGFDGEIDAMTPYDLTVSPDGRHVYAALRNQMAINVYARDKSSGCLTYLESRRQKTLYGAVRVAVSPDGRFAYSAAIFGNYLTAFARNTETGHLGSFQSQRQTDIPVLDEPNSLAFSPDAKHLYVGASGSEAVLLFRRDQETGRLTFVSSQQQGTDRIPHRLGAMNVAVSRDGRNVYCAGNNGITQFTRDKSTGELSFKNFVQDGNDGIRALGGVNHLAISEDGRSVYATCPNASSICLFQRDSATGDLTFIEAMENLRDGITGMKSPVELAISPDQQKVLVVCNDKGDNSIVLFDRNQESGRLTFVDKMQDGINGAEGLQGAIGVAFSPDGKHIYVASRASKAIATFGLNKPASTRN